MTDTFSISLISDLDELDRVTVFIRDISTHIGCDDEKEHQIMLAITEAVTNAIIHGNTYDPSKKITIHAVYRNRRLTVTIRDEGKGFDPGNIPDPRKAENLLKPSGRGIWLMREYADEVTFLENGRCVEIHFDMSQ